MYAGYPVDPVVADLHAALTGVDEAALPGLDPMVDDDLGPEL